MKQIYYHRGATSQIQNPKILRSWTVKAVYLGAIKNANLFSYKLTYYLLRCDKLKETKSVLISHVILHRGTWKVEPKNVFTKLLFSCESSKFPSLSTY